MLRLFVAFEVPEAQKDSVQKAIASVAVPGARWTSRESWHVTLKFLGATAEERLAEVTGVVEQAASTSQPARTSLQDLGAFPSFRRARVLWVGLDDPGGVLAARTGAGTDPPRRAALRCEAGGPVPLPPEGRRRRLRTPGRVPVGTADLNYNHTHVSTNL